MITRLGAWPAVLLAIALTVPAASLHATRGVVTALGRAEMVIARPRNRGAITIVLSDATRVDGALAIGAIVSVRYHDEGPRHVATAIAVEPPH